MDAPRGGASAHGAGDRRAPARPDALGSLSTGTRCVRGTCRRPEAHPVDSVLHVLVPSRFAEAARSRTSGPRLVSIGADGTCSRHRRGGVRRVRLRRSPTCLQARGRGRRPRQRRSRSTLWTRCSTKGETRSEAREGLELVQGDITDGWRLLLPLRRAPQSVDRIVHLASPLTNAIRESPAAGLAAMCGGTANVLEAARMLRMRRVVWASSISVFGQPPPEPWSATTSPRRAGESLYGSGKVLCEDLAAAYRADARRRQHRAAPDGPLRRLAAPRLGAIVRSGLRPGPLCDARRARGRPRARPASRLALRRGRRRAHLPRARCADASGETTSSTPPARRRRGASLQSEIAEAVVQRERACQIEPDHRRKSDRVLGEARDEYVNDDGALRSQIGYGSHHSTCVRGIEATVAAYRQAGSKGDSPHA